MAQQRRLITLEAFNTFEGQTSSQAPQPHTLPLPIKDPTKAIDRFNPTTKASSSCSSSGDIDEKSGKSKHSKAKFIKKREKVKVTPKLQERRKPDEIRFRYLKRKIVIPKVKIFVNGTSWLVLQYFLP